MKVFWGISLKVFSKAVAMKILRKKFKKPSAVVEVRFRSVGV